MLSSCQTRPQPVTLSGDVVEVKGMESDKPRDTELSELKSHSDRGLARCDACGSEMKPMGHCKYWCLICGFLRTCNDVI